MPHSREKRVTNSTVTVEKRELNNNKSGILSIIIAILRKLFNK